MKLLIIEDSARDALLLSQYLTRQGLEFSFERVDNLEDTKVALQREHWDAVISDYVLPDYGALEALELLRELRLDLPFIVISGAVTEEVAVETLRAGAHDFVSKNALDRLVPALMREVREATNREALRTAELRIKAAQEAELFSKAKAEAARKYSFLAEISKRLAQALNLDEAFAKLAHLCLPDVADWYLIELAHGATGGRRVHVGHFDPEKRSLASDLRESVSAESSSWEVRHSMLLGGASIASDGVGYADRSRELMGLLGAASSIVVPLRARNQVLGMLTFYRGDAERCYDPDEIWLAEEVAGRFALTLDNVSLYIASKEAIGARDQFLSIASHELNTPITSLKLQLQMANRVLERDGLGANALGRVQKSISNSLAQIESLTGLVDELLDVAHIRAGTVKLHLEEVRLADLVQTVIAQYSEVLNRCGCSVQLDLDGSVVGNWDKSKLMQVITNLISNVIKYAPGKPLSVTLKSDSSSAILQFRDHGPGITKEHQCRIFERFERAIGSSHVSGLGLGLFIIDQIVRVHGGVVRLDKSDGEGSLFTVQLPLRAGAAGIVTSAPAQDIRAHG